MKAEDAIKELNAMEREDPEYQHQRADQILLDVLCDNDLQDVAESYAKCRERVHFWYA